ncbi:MAG: SDR family NAD(P)-dependent oxidoreductase, partial [Bacteroidia bacterium]
MALITGASGGIGYEMVKQFAADGISLLLIARSTNKLQELQAEVQQQYPQIK